MPPPIEPRESLDSEPSPPPGAESARSARGPLRYYDFVMAAFVTVLLCSNLIGATKVAAVDLGWPGKFSFSSGVLFFPFSYIFGDILTEVYGYARTRRVVWAGFAGLGFASLMSLAIVAMPPAENWPDQEAYETVFGLTWRIALASLIAYWAGEFANSYVMARMKVWMKGRLLWTRTIGSTVAGQAVDSALFYPIAFLGVWDTMLVVEIMIAQYFLKTAWEAIVTPFTYWMVFFLKRRENVDHYDIDTNFNPFSLKF